MGEDRRHGVRCATQATGETWAFLWQLLLLFSPHGRSPVTATRRDVKATQRRGELPVSRGGTRKDRRLLVPPRAHRQPLDLPGCRQHGCHFVEEKKKPVSVQRAAGFPSKGGKLRMRDAFKSRSPKRSPVAESWELIWAFILVRVFTACARQSAATWPDRSDCAELDAHTGSSSGFCCATND